MLLVVEVLRVSVVDYHGLVNFIIFGMIPVPILALVLFLFVEELTGQKRPGAKVAVLV